MLQSRAGVLIRRLIILFALSLLCGLSARAQETKGRTIKHEQLRPTRMALDSRREIAAIRAVLEEQVKAWNRGDLEAFMKGYWQSDQLTFFSGGAKTHGWQATLDRYRRTYQSGGREMGRLEFVDLDIQLLGSRGAFVRGGWELRTPKEQRGGLFTLILRKTERGWKIIHDHTGAKEP